MSTTTAISINGAIEFRFSVTDWELARQIDQLLTKNVHSIVRSASVSTRVNGNGHAKKRKPSRDSGERILQLLKEKFGSASFKRDQAISLIEDKLGLGSSTTARALQFGKEQKRIASENKGIFHFLESGTTQPPATGSGKPKEPIPLHAST